MAEPYVGLEDVKARLQNLYGKDFELRKPTAGELALLTTWNQEIPGLLQMTTVVDAGEAAQEYLFRPDPYALLQGTAVKAIGADPVGTPGDLKADPLWKWLGPGRDDQGKVVNTGWLFFGRRWQYTRALGGGQIQTVVATVGLYQMMWPRLPIVAFNTNSELGDSSRVLCEFDVKGVTDRVLFNSRDNADVFIHPDAALYLRMGGDTWAASNKIDITVQGCWKYIPYLDGTTR